MDESSHNPPINLSEIKKQIASEIRPLIHQLKDPEDRFYALLELLKGKWDDNLVTEAFKAAKEIHDIEQKVRSLQTLLSEISYHESEEH